MKTCEILIIDSNKNFTDAVRKELRQKGVNAATANSKKEAFLAIAAKQRNKQSFSVIAVDMHCQFLSHAEITSWVSSLGGVMPYVLFTTSADKLLQRSYDDQAIKPKLIVNRMINALDNQMCAC